MCYNEGNVHLFIAQIYWNIKNFFLSLFLKVVSVIILTRIDVRKYRQLLRLYDSEQIYPISFATNCT